MKLDFRPYEPGDEEEVLDFFDSNCPAYFAPQDRPELLSFLRNQADKNFLMLVHAGRPVGCGGHYVHQAEQRFGIAWVMFRRHALGAANFHKMANELLTHMLQRITAEGLPYDVVINTTQRLATLFKRYGFRTEKVVENGFGPGLDHYQMCFKPQ